MRPGEDDGIGDFGPEGRDRAVGAAVVIDDELGNPGQTMKAGPFGDMGFFVADDQDNGNPRPVGPWPGRGNVDAGDLPATAQKSEHGPVLAEGAMSAKGWAALRYFGARRAARAAGGRGDGCSP